MKTGEGYHLCKEVCQQTDHAEINALKAAGPAARGGIMYIEGHTYACAPCQDAAAASGIKFIAFGAPPAPEVK
jgi:pyrimidine deaminase RibD-like protein